MDEGMHQDPFLRQAIQEVAEEYNKSPEVLMQMFAICLFKILKKADDAEHSLEIELKKLSDQHDY